MVDYVVYGRRSFDQLDGIIAPRCTGSKLIFLVDNFFENKPLINRIPVRGNVKINLADITYEPKTTYVDKLAQQLKEEFGSISGIIGIGGSSTMDLVKTVSLMASYAGGISIAYSQIGVAHAVGYALSYLLDTKKSCAGYTKNYKHLS
jgi:3-deoxy-alpha-D-manno-octulosonate 8-oxidase